MKSGRSCLLWLALYVLLVAAVVFVVERRVGRHGPVFIAGAIAGFIAILGFSHLAKFVRRAGELMLIRKGMAGDEPQEGARFAAIGTISPIGGARLVSPLTRTPAVAYSYLIAGNMKWDGKAMIPCSIRSGAHSIRLLEFPELAFPHERPGGESILRHAEEYVRTTEFPKEMSKDDGTMRRDHGPSGKPQSLNRSMFFEQVIKPGDVVCAIGTYSASRAALVSSRLEKWEPGKALLARIGAMGNSLLNAVIILAIVTAALTALYAFVPLNVSRPSWLEIRLEDLLDERVREPIYGADLLPIPRVEAGELLNAGEARGRIRTPAGEATVTRATGEWSDRDLVISLFEADKEVGRLTVNLAGDLKGLKLMNDDIPVPPASFTFRKLGENEVVGRLSWMKNDVPAIHVIFRTTIGQ